ncbi:PEP-CTERM putative exosortase interaction domain-containing protein [Opitutaceae bacterium TAV1]|nr:PEP-CTERM putative exosortase interaction domain-containing protein [Opitutaceae bacterium TAV1]
MKTQHIRLSAGLFAALLTLTLTLSAQILYWETATGTWSTSSAQSNWSPTSGEAASTYWVDNSHAVIESANPNITIGQSGALTVEAASLTVQNGATFGGGGTAARRLNVAGSISGNFTVNITASGGGGITANGAANYNGTATIQSGSFILNHTEAGGTDAHIVLSGGSLGLGTAIANNSVTIGSLSGTGSVSPNIGGTTGTRTLVINQSTNTTFSGTFIAGTTNRVLAVTKSGSGTLILEGANAHQGQTLVNAGSLVLAAESTLAAATGDVVVNGATAILSTSVANANVGGNLTLSEGILRLNDTSAGSLTLAAGKDFTMSGGSIELSLDTIHDQIFGDGGNFSITGGTLVLDVTGAGFSYENSWQIFSSFAGGSVTDLTIIGYDTAQYTAVLGNDGYLGFTAIPEPSALALITGGVTLGSILCRRRRNRC